MQPRVILPMKQPNVGYLLADQLRARSLPAYGERQIATPNLDRLVRERIRFSNAVATCSLCAPYRSMLVTGRQPLKRPARPRRLPAARSGTAVAAAERTRWKGVRTGRWSDWRCLDGSTALYDIRADPLQVRDLVATSADHRRVVARMEATLGRFMSEWHDAMQPATEYLNWFDGRRIMRNTFGPLGDPLAEPDWSLL